jgi:glucokinase
LPAIIYGIEEKRKTMPKSAVQSERGHPKHELFIGVDIGGTKILAVLMSPSGTVFQREVIQVDEPVKHNLPETVATLVKGIIHPDEGKAKEIGGVGIGITSILDQAQDRLLFSPSYPHYVGRPLKTIMEGHLNYPVVLDNDLNAAAWGERCLGNGKPFSSFYMITIGTACGGSFIYKNEIYRGLSGTSLLGHVTLIPEGGPLCTCGKTGCVQSVVSGTAIARRAREMLERGRAIRFPHAVDPRNVTSRDVFDAAAMNDSVAQEIVDEVAAACGLAVSNIIHLFNPEAVIIGGGVAQAGAFFLDRVRESARKRLLVEAEFKCTILPAGLGPDATAFGAAMLAAANQGGGIETIVELEA